jgi:2,4-dienoyl-CoA reductase-like NADH-dependent reductase (Old Yellow Enzyme family)
MPDLFSPLELRGMQLRNRITISPMCMYSAVDGVPNDFHVQHLASRSAGGAGLIITEATGVEARGRITWACTGMYSDQQEAAWSRVVDAVHLFGGKIAMQLAHSGRKASTDPIFPHPGTPTRWTPIGVTDQPFSETSLTPIAMTPQHINQVRQAFVDAAGRCVRAGFDAVEVHAAHGYLLHSFYSPLSNTRTDEFGGSFDNRVLFLRWVVAGIRAAIPDTMPILVRLSTTDWRDDGWTIDDSVRLAGQLKRDGADVIDCSTGGAIPNVVIPSSPGFQVQFARAIRERSQMSTGAVGLITSSKQADDIIREEQADLVLIGRESLRDPNFPIRAARELGVAQKCPPPGQYSRGW